MCAQLRRCVQQAVRPGAGVCSVWPLESSSCKAASSLHSMLWRNPSHTQCQVDAAGSRPLRRRKSAGCADGGKRVTPKQSQWEDVASACGAVAAFLQHSCCQWKKLSHPDEASTVASDIGRAGTFASRMLSSCLCWPTASYTASQNTVARTSTVWLSHITDILPSVLSFHRTVLAACSPAPACTHKAVLANIKFTFSEALRAHATCTLLAKSSPTRVVDEALCSSRSHKSQSSYRAS